MNVEFMVQANLNGWTDERTHVLYIDRRDVVTSMSTSPQAGSQKNSGFFFSKIVFKTDILHAYQNKRAMTALYCSTELQAQTINI